MTGSGAPSARSAHEGIRVALLPESKSGTEALHWSERYNRPDHDLRAEMGPDGVLLWVPQSQMPRQAVDDPRLRRIVKEFPDLVEWQPWVFRWLSILYDRAYTKFLQEKKGKGSVFQRASMATTKAIRLLKVFLLDYLGQKEGESWKHADWRQDPRNLLLRRATVEEELALRDDFWQVCCQPLMKRKARKDGYELQVQSHEAASRSRALGEFLSFVAQALNSGAERPVGFTYCSPFWIKSATGTPIIGGDGRPLPKVAKGADRSLSWVEIRCPQLREWTPFAVEYIGQLQRSLATAISGIGIFIESYLGNAGEHGTPMENLSREVASSPSAFLSRSNRCPDTFKELCKSEASVGFVVEFLDWLLLNYYSIEDDYGDPVIISGFRNPLTAATWSGKQKYRRTVREAMPFLWIERLRRILVQGESFRDWKVAQNFLGRNASWFEVPEEVIDKSDPDCVWRRRLAGRREHGRAIVEIWSPVRWVALVIKLTTALRTLQVRVLDSGESDQWRFDLRRWAEGESPWILNDVAKYCPALCLGLQQELIVAKQGHSRRDPSDGWSNGVLRRMTEHGPRGFVQGTLLYANTNKTADSSKQGPAKGFELPLPLEECPVRVGDDGRLCRPVFQDLREEYLWFVSLSRNAHYWLAKLRDWQCKYNPINRHIKWKELDGSNLIITKSDEQYSMYQDACFAFREPAIGPGRGHKASWPVSAGVVHLAWLALCKELEAQFRDEGKTQNGEPIILIDVEDRFQKTPTYDLHSIRVSLVTAWIVDGGIDPDVVMLLTGHSRLVMLLYYNARTMRSAQEAISRGQQRIDAEKAQKELDFIRNATVDEILSKTAFNDAESLINALGGADAEAARRLAGWMRMPEGLCPVGGNTVRIPDEASIAGCFNGGPAAMKGNSSFHGPVEGGDHNCPNCRWFVTTIAYLEALCAKFNITAFHMRQALDRTRSQDKIVHDLEAELYEAGERRADDVYQAELLERVEQAQKRFERYGAEYTTLATTVLNTKRLIDRLLEVARVRDGGAEPLVFSGGEVELAAVLERTDSELLQLHVVAESYAVYPEFDSGEAIWRRSQILDAALVRDGIAPMFLQLSKEDQLEAGSQFLTRIGRSLSPSTPTNGVMAGIKAIDSKANIADLLQLSKSGLEKLLKESTKANRKVIRLALDQSALQVAG